MNMDEHRYELFTCTRCGLSEECTPTRDFYSIPDFPGALLCEGCFARRHGLPMLRVEGG